MIRSQITGVIELQKIATLLESFPEDVIKFAQNILNQPRWKDILIAMNIENLDNGIRPDSTPIEKVPVGKQTQTRYERYTIYLKKERGLEIGYDSPVTLKDTGEFRGAIEIKILSDGIYFLDRDWKGEILEGIWGEVLGITEDQLFKFTDMILPYFEEWLLKRFNQ